MDRLRSLETRIVVSTDVVAKGVEVPTIDHVIQYDIPPGPEALDVFFQRVSYAGQAGVATSLFKEGEHTSINILPSLVSMLTKANQDIPMWMHENISTQDALIHSPSEDDAAATESATLTKKHLHRRMHSSHHCARSTAKRDHTHAYPQDQGQLSYQSQYPENSQMFQPYSYTTGGYIGQTWYPPVAPPTQPTVADMYNMRYYPQYYSPLGVITPGSSGMGPPYEFPLYATQPSNSYSYHQMYMAKQDRRQQQRQNNQSQSARSEYGDEATIEFD